MNGRAISDAARRLAGRDARASKEGTGMGHLLVCVLLVDPVHRQPLRQLLPPPLLTGPCAELLIPGGFHVQGTIWAI